MPVPGDIVPLEALFYDSNDALVDPTTPLVDVELPIGTTVVTDAVPTRISVGYFTYAYQIPAGAAPGSGRGHFTGTVEGEPLSGDDYFEVTAAPVVSPALVTVARYRTITGDITTTDAAVTGALVDSQGLIEEWLRRELDSTERTETLRLIDGRVYPKAYPITNAGELTIERTRAILGSAEISPPIWNLPSNSDSYATVTYIGGFTAATLPKTLEREIARTAHNILHPSLIPAGALSVSQGDASVTFGKAQSNGELDAASRRALRPYRNVLT
jgi:hypothetical protein